MTAVTFPCCDIHSAITHYVAVDWTTRDSQVSVLGNPRARSANECAALAMAPKRGQSIEKTEEHEEFLKKVAVYHEKRG